MDLSFRARCWSRRDWLDTAALPPALRTVSRLTALVLLCGFLFFYHLGARDLWSSHEGRAAQDAQSMVGDGYWGVPRLFDQQHDLQKPPLYYWMVAVVSAARGGIVDACSVRLPAALSALATVCVVFLFSAGRGKQRAGMLAAVLLATSVHFTWLARIGRIDMPLTLAVSLALLAFFEGIRRSADPNGGRSWPWFLTGYVALAVAFMLKGPIGLVLPGAVLVVHGCVETRLRGWAALHAARLSLIWGVPLVLLLAMPWFVWASAQTDGKLVSCFLWYHNVERAFGGSGGLRAHPWWFYAPRLFVDLLPWSPVVPLAAWDLCRLGRWRADPEARFGFIWLVVMVLVLSCARFKRADYLLPAYPGAAILTGCVLVRRLEGSDRAGEGMRSRTATAALGFLAAAGALGGWWYYVDHVLPEHEPVRECRSFAATVRRAAPAPQLVIFFRAESHALAFHVGRPLNTVLEWENVDVWVRRPGAHYFVMPPECVGEWSQHITAAKLEVIATNEVTGRHDHPLVLAHSVPLSSAR